MATLKGLFEPKPRSQRNFLLENKREVKAKSTLNSRKNEVTVNLSKNQRSSLNSLLSSSHQNTHSRHSTLKCPRQNTHNNPSVSGVSPISLQHLKKDYSQKPQHSKQIKKPYRPTFMQKPASSGQTMRYIDQENVPFEWTEVCPSLISHNICHQGVQTDESKCDGLTKQFRILSTKDVPDTDCDKGENQPHAHDAQASMGLNHYASSIDRSHRSSSHSSSSRKGTGNSRGDAGRKLDSVPRVQSTVPKQNSEEDCTTLENSTYAPIEIDHANRLTSAKSSCLVSHLENAKLSMSRKCHVNGEGQGDSLFYPPSYRKGAIPKYLNKRKTEQALASAHAKQIDPNCPEGHVVMPDIERRETLDMILKNYNDLITELNKIPVRTDTLKMKLRKLEIEKQLDKLEEGIRVFSRSKVYVKLDA